MVKAKTTNHSIEKWVSYKETIRRLYLDLELSLNELRQTMERDHGFSASNRQYKSRLRSWKFRRSIKQEEKVFMVLTEIHRKKEYGKDTAFKLCGRLIKDGELSRQRSIIKRQGIDIPQRSKTPSDIEYFTPPGSVLDSQAPSLVQTKGSSDRSSPVESDTDTWWQENVEGKSGANRHGLSMTEELSDDFEFSLDVLLDLDDDDLWAAGGMD